jgi:NIMA (never in mitosis gene a)-related kinase
MFENHSTVSFPKDFTYNQQLQKGSEGHVEQWTHTATKTVIAVKVIQSSVSCPNEVQILRDLPPHKSIVGYLGYCKKQPHAEEASILLEYCPQGDLFTVRHGVVDKDSMAFSEAFMWSIYSQLMGALAFLHEGIDNQHPMGHGEWKPVVHRDIKLENVLVKRLSYKNECPGIEVRLGDFGMAGYYDSKDPNPLGYTGTTQYWPPEVTWETKRLDLASDVWGVAAIMHQLAHNFGPLVDPQVTANKWFQQNNEAPYHDSWPEHLKRSYWSSKAPRRPVPINLEPSAPVPVLADDRLGYDKNALALRRHIPSLKYSDALSDCMMAGLTMSPDERPESGILLRKIEAAYSDVLFEDLCLEYERETVLEDGELWRMRETD